CCRRCNTGRRSTRRSARRPAAARNRKDEAAMKTKIAGAVGVIVLSLAVVGALHFRGVAAESERELAALTAKKAEAAKALAAAQDRAMAAARDEQELSSALAAAEEQQKQAAAAHDKAAAEAKARTTALARNDIGALLEANPELRALFRKSFQADQRLRYAPLIQQLGLDEAKVQRLLDMATDLEETGFDITSAAHAQGLADDDPALAHMRKDASAKVRPAVMEILGEQGYAQYEQYQRMAPLSGFVGEVSSLAIGSGAPLSVEQTGKLM